MEIKNSGVAGIDHSCHSNVLKTEYESECIYFAIFG